MSAICKQCRICLLRAIIIPMPGMIGVEIVEVHFNSIIRYPAYFEPPRASTLVVSESSMERFRALSNRGLTSSYGLKNDQELRP
jgi:hypothetical protein